MSRPYCELVAIGVPFIHETLALPSSSRIIGCHFDELQQLVVFSVEYLPTDGPTYSDANVPVEPGRVVMSGQFPPVVAS